MSKFDMFYGLFLEVLNDVKDDTEILAVIDRSGSMTTVFDAQGVQQVRVTLSCRDTVLDLVHN